jgi:hypothetical protein
LIFLQDLSCGDFFSVHDCRRSRRKIMTFRKGDPLDCMEYMPLTLEPLENPSHDPGAHQVLDAHTAHVFGLRCDRERAERIVASLNYSAAALSTAFDPATIERCAEIALAIDSGRGNEKEIAKAIRALTPEVES